MDFQRYALDLSLSDVSQIYLLIWIYLAAKYNAIHFVCRSPHSSGPIISDTTIKFNGMRSAFVCMLDSHSQLNFE